MPLDPKTLGEAIRARRLEAGLTQAELAERLSVSAQSVSHWECADTAPDISLLPDLACILGTSVDMLLGSPGSRYRRRITVGDMRQAIGCILRLRELLGADHFMYRTMVDALDTRMNSRSKQPSPAKTPWTPMSAKRCWNASPRATGWTQPTSAATSGTKRPATTPSTGCRRWA